MIPFILESSFSILFVKILSISMAVCEVTLVGFVISGENENVKSCSANVFE
jgi:hypothetical protein